MFFIPNNMKSKKAVVSEMVGIGIGIIILATIAVIGMAVLGNIADSQSSCKTGYAWNATLGKCSNTSDGTGTAATASFAATSAFYGAGYLGSTTSGGLLTWLPVIIPAVIGIAIIGYFLMLRGRGKGY